MSATRAMRVGGWGRSGESASASAAKSERSVSRASACLRMGVRGEGAGGGAGSASKGTDCSSTSSNRITPSRTQPPTAISAAAISVARLRRLPQRQIFYVDLVQQVLALFVVALRELAAAFCQLVVRGDSEHFVELRDGVGGALFLQCFRAEVEVRVDDHSLGGCVLRILLDERLQARDRFIVALFGEELLGRVEHRDLIRGRVVLRLRVGRERLHALRIFERGLRGRV